jgi:formylglycine-generating enzyme required for sulfatase activity
MSSNERARAPAVAVLEPPWSAEQATAFHWPKFAGVLCGTQTDRERLGLPPEFQPDRFHEDLPVALSALRADPVERLIEVLGDPAQSLVERYAAGQLLALLGDPRLTGREPRMVDIPGGLVEIGLPEDQIDPVLAHFAQLGLDADWIRKECPRHKVPLAPYRIARFPVSNQEFREFLMATGYPEIPSSWSFRRFPVERANHPVYGVSPSACDSYAAWLAAQTGRRFRLPSEAEWEFAAAGPEGREFPWGERFDATLCNCCETGIFETTPVGMFPEGASPFGIQDMAGNVEEYLADDYAPYPGGAPIDDHLRQIHGSYRLARGGSFARFRDLARTRRRHGHNPRSVSYVMGFRLAESP